MKGAVPKSHRESLGVEMPESALAGVIDAVDVIGKSTITTNATISPVKLDRRRSDATACLLIGERKQLDQPRTW